jgi:hypothetical protein
MGFRNSGLYNEDREEEAFARQRFFGVVLLFKDVTEKNVFLGFVHQHKEEFLGRFEALMRKELGHISNDNRHIVERLITGKVLNQMLIEFRGNQETFLRVT